MFCAILKAKNSSFQKAITLCRSTYVKKNMKLLAFIFEQPSYTGSGSNFKRRTLRRISASICNSQAMGQ